MELYFSILFLLIDDFINLYFLKYLLDYLIIRYLRCPMLTL